MNTIMCRAGEYVLAAIAFLLLVAPVVHFLFAGWKSKRKEILDSFNDTSIRYYFDLFFPGEAPTNNPPHTHLANYYDKRFGRRHFILAIIVLLAISVSMICFAAWACFLWLRPTENRPVLVIPAIAVAATVGAYAWVALDLIMRDHQGDMHPKDVFHASYRLLVAVPLAIGITALFTEQTGVPLAILLGAFPTQTLITITRRGVAKLVALEGIADPTSDLESLQGIYRNEADRFKEERVSTILQLAYADPVVLTMKTSFAFSYVVDCCSQALAWLYFEKDLQKMRRLGLRGAQEIRCLVQDLGNPERSERAQKCVKSLGRALKIDINILVWVLEAIALDPYTLFLWKVWGITPPQATKEATPPPLSLLNKGTNGDTHLLKARASPEPGARPRFRPRRSRRSRGERLTPGPGPTGPRGSRER